MSENKPRRLKVERAGDFSRKKYKPYLRLAGKWLRECGLEPNTYVEATNPQKGVLVVTADTLPEGR